LKKSSGLKVIAIIILVFAAVMLTGAVNAHLNPSIASSTNSLTFGVVLFGVVLFGIIPAIIGLLVYRKALKIQKEENNVS
jgi:heme/copper-type cytochrome/quinol oxidase subunit 2